MAQVLIALIIGFFTIENLYNLGSVEMTKIYQGLAILGAFMAFSVNADIITTDDWDGIKKISIANQPNDTKIGQTFTLEAGDPNTQLETITFFAQNLEAFDITVYMAEWGLYSPSDAFFSTSDIIRESDGASDFEQLTVNVNQNLATGTEYVWYCAFSGPDGTFEEDGLGAVGPSYTLYYDGPDKYEGGALVWNEGEWVRESNSDLAMIMDFEAPTPTPEPASLSLLGIGLLSLGLAARSRKKS